MLLLLSHIWPCTLLCCTVLQSWMDVCFSALHCAALRSHCLLHFPFIGSSCASADSVSHWRREWHREMEGVLFSSPWNVRVHSSCTESQWHGQWHTCCTLKMTQETNSNWTQLTHYLTIMSLLHVLCVHSVLISGATIWLRTMKNSSYNTECSPVAECRGGGGPCVMTNGAFCYYSWCFMDPSQGAWRV